MTRAIEKCHFENENKNTNNRGESLERRVFSNGQSSS